VRDAFAAQDGLPVATTEPAMAELDRLLTELRAEPVSAVSPLIEAVGPGLGRSDWDAVLYAIQSIGEGGQMDRAIALLGACAAEAERERNGRLLRGARQFLGELYRFSGRFDQAIATFRTVAELGKEAADQDGYEQASIALSSLASVCLAQGNVAGAIAAIEEAMPIDDRIDSPVYAIEDRLELGLHYLTQEDFSRSDAVAAEALRRSRVANRPFLAALALSHQAGIRADLGEFGAAAELYEQELRALDAIDEPEDLEMWAKVLGDAHASLGLARQELGDLDGAVASYRRADAVFRELGDRRLRATVLAWQGTAEVERGQPRPALGRFKTAARLARLSGDVRGLVVIDFHRASALQALGQFGRAEAAVNRAMTALAGVADAPEVLDAALLTKLGEISLARGRPDRAATHIERARAALPAGGVGSIERLVLAQLGEAYWHLGDLPRAYDTLRSALRSYESKRRTVADPMSRISFAPSRELLYARLVPTCLSLNRPVEALDVLEEGRARVLREQLATRLPGTELDESLSWPLLRELVAGTSATPESTKSEPA
jgi:tetratricopeptide (TPR) repeat protein